MVDSPLMLEVKLPVVNRIQPQSNKLNTTGVENKVTVTQTLMITLMTTYSLNLVMDGVATSLPVA